MYKDSNGFFYICVKVICIHFLEGNESNKESENYFNLVSC